ncbi:MAG TPA: non-homologous end-joining DNA ligase [Pseudonocardiaceae bacterium]|nr:non-homologous end-joining DNA ligase [Pseudonocardiaceae bacterium]
MERQRRLIQPMLATPGEVPAGVGWAFEFKWDGVRAVSYLDSSTERGSGGSGDRVVQVFSRNAKDISATYPELGALREQFGGSSLIVDGEIVALDESGRPSFARLQNRMHVARPDEDLLAATPVRYYLFDLLAIDGHDTTQLPYLRRRELLAELVPDDAVPELVLPPLFTDVAGRDVLAAAREHRLEGVIAKRQDSRYEPGRRSRSWIKTPLVSTQEVIIGGWRAGAGRRAGTIGSLLLGAPTSAGLHYLGHVGTGFTDAVLRELTARLRPLAARESPFGSAVPREHARDAHWVRPELVGEVEYRQLTTDGMLRHSSWRGLRADKDPAEVTMPGLP